MNLLKNLQNMEVMVQYVFYFKNGRRLVDTFQLFIYEHKSKSGTHFQGNKYFEIFIEEVQNIKDFDFNNVKFGREIFNRRIDFII